MSNVSQPQLKGNTMPHIKTRSEAVQLLVKHDKVEALAKVAINEVFNQIPPDEPDDKLRMVIGEKDSLVLDEVSPETVLAAFDEVIGEDVEVDPQGISILGKLKYDLEGNVLPEK